MNTASPRWPRSLPAAAICCSRSWSGSSPIAAARMRWRTPTPWRSSPMSAADSSRARAARISWRMAVRRFAPCRGNKWTRSSRSSRDSIRTIAPPSKTQSSKSRTTTSIRKRISSGNFGAWRFPPSVTSSSCVIATASRRYCARASITARTDGRSMVSAICSIQPIRPAKIAAGSRKRGWALCADRLTLRRTHCRSPIA